jgi:hypothetical protein
MSNILEQANNIINNRSEEKERQYGPMGAGFERAALIASGMSGKDWSAHDMFIAMIALKFSRQSYNFKEDNLLDAVAYIGAWQNYINDTKPAHAGPDVPPETKNEKSKNEKTLLTEEKKKSFEEEDTSDQEFFGQEVVASSPYSEAFKTPDPRALLEAMISMGEK